MSETTVHTHALHFSKFSPHLPLTYSYNYMSLTPSEVFLGYNLFNFDIERHSEEIEDWNDPTLPLLKRLYLDSIEEDVELGLTQMLWDQSPTLVSFFTSQLVDIPQSFRKSKSLYSDSMSTPNLRIITMLMRHGRKTYTSKLYSHSLLALTSQIINNNSLTSEIRTWRTCYNIFTNVLVTGPTPVTATSTFNRSLPKLYAVDKFNQPYDSLKTETNIDHWVYNLVSEELSKYIPLFSFYVRKVDKMKRKHSRGKSGKYSIIWKYVPKYKRFITVLRWLVRDVRFQKSRTFSERLLRSLESLLFDKTSHLIYKLRNFVHFYVFQNYRKTLLRTLKSTM